MWRYVLCLVVLAIAPLQVMAQPPEEVVSVRPVPIRFSPPTPWLLGLPGWQVAHTEASERYQVLRTLEIRAFSSTQTWAEVSNEETQGWVYWGESLNDNRNFVIENRPEDGDTQGPDDRDGH